jgi:TPR repeat protein
MVFPGAEDYATGLDFVKKQDITSAIPWFEKAIAQDNPEANYHMGLLYARGDNVAQDYTKAREHFYSAAMMGHPKALYYLGHLYAEGSGVEQDYFEALKWFWLSASYGDKGAKSFMRVMVKKLSPEEYSLAEVEVETLWKKLPHDVFLTKEKMVLH